jgi:hypothetical protein
MQQKLATSGDGSMAVSGIWGRQHGCLQQEHLIFLENDNKGQT